MNYKTKTLVLMIIIYFVFLLGFTNNVQAVGYDDNNLDMGYASSNVKDKTGTYTYISSSSGIFIDQYLGKDTELEIPETIDGKTVIGLCSEFLGGSPVVKLTIPVTVKTIYTDAFWGAWNLEEINVVKQNSIYASDNGILYSKDWQFLVACPCNKRGEVNVRKGTRYVCDYSFMGATQVTSISFSPTVEDVGYMALYDTGALNSIKIDAANKYFTFSNGILYDKEKKMVVKCLQNRSSSISIPTSATTIAEYAFADCVDLPGSIYIPGSVKEIKEKAFYNCSSIEGRISFPSNLKTVGSAAFYGCSNIVGVDINSKLTEIPEDCFGECYGIESITIPGNVKVIGERAFFDCYNVESLDIRNGVETISSWAFSNLPSLTGNLVIPDSIKTVGECAFDYSPNIDGYIIFGSGVEKIGNSVIYSCSNAKGVIFKCDVPEIDEYAFDEPYINYYCASNKEGFQELLKDKDVYLYSDTPIITFVLDGETYKRIQHLQYGLTIDQFVEPKLEGYVFSGWYYDEDYTNQYDFSDPIMYDTNIYARFEEELKYRLGDVNFDGLVNADDASRILDFYKYNNATAEERKVADVNKDGAINADDAAAVLDIYKYNK